MLFLHLVRDKTAVPVLKSDFLDGVLTKQTHKGDEVRYGEVLYFGTIVQRKYWVALCQKAKENHAARPHINCSGLLGEVKQSLRRHVAFGPGPILDLDLLL